jgi:FeS assembly SUF system protein
MLAVIELEQKIIEALKTVFDPEIPVDIYELGLIYDISLDEDANATLTMTLTAPSCFAAEQIPVDVEKRVREVEGVKNVTVTVSFDPPWTQEMMSEEAKLTLGFL